jgi:ATP-dependent helicase/nuclease subunit A
MLVSAGAPEGLKQRNSTPLPLIWDSRLYPAAGALYPASMDSTQLATSPQHSATVMASAGTGKTWLLVTRLVRLLIEGAAPDAILAITFTRKAAAEMAARLNDRLHDLASIDDAARSQALLEMGITPSAVLLRQTASLYEKHLFASRQVRVTTFHAFCQELLRRFPLEADVPAGFDVLEGPRQLQETAWDALVDEATRTPDSPVAQALEAMFREFNGHQGTKTALMRFLHHRSDWWAHTLGQTQPVDYAYQTLASQLAVVSEHDPLEAGLTASRREDLQSYAKLLMRHGTATLAKAASHIGEALTPKPDKQERLISLTQALLKKSVTPKPSKSLVKSLGEDGQQRLLTLHEKLASWLLDIQDQYRRRDTLALSHAWFAAGTRLLAHYQRLKIEQRVLDFSDLEWKAFLLLNHADHALWVQYKLDQGIDHLLIDEFQDTNPTQWHLIFPLLQELAANEGERQRTVFLVGDAKQSIYRFRRAEPDLFPAAQDWLRAQLHAVDHALSTSWRSAPAIIDFVNRVFESGPLRAQLPEFHPHTTHRASLWGQVSVLPLIASEDTGQTAFKGLRNPLQQPRVLLKDQRHRQEGEMIAAQIQSLLERGTVVGQDEAARPLRYDDILILVRSRNHVHDYEEALRTSGIPYVTASRGTLLDCIEIRDMVALLDILIVPFNNLNLATVLRSPLFTCSDQDLMRLAAEPGANWLERLLVLAPQLKAGTPLARAAHWLSRWHNLAGQRPVHDLLDRIYSEGNVAARYESAFPAHLRPRVRANLTRFIELALEMDSGRYPSLTAFLERLNTLKVLEEDAPDEAADNAVAGNVRLLTIHAAKGLEAPVVFLADAAAMSPAARAYQAMVRWPAQADRPSHFLLCGKTSEADLVTATLLEHEAQEEQREQTNLLYVALTRAKQALFISGCKAKRGEDLGWYGAIAAQVGNVETICRTGWSLNSGTPASSVPHPASASATVTVMAGLASPLSVAPADVEIAPSSGVIDNESDIEGDEEGRERGLAIHRFLQLLTDGAQPAPALILRRIRSELNLDETSPAPAQWLAEAERLIKNPAFRDWFDPSRYRQAYNEIPIYYYSGDRLVHGIVDRLVVNDDGCILIDYKTHRSATSDKLEALIAPYHEQLRLYVEGIKRLWPGKTVRAFLLFTACSVAVEWREMPNHD